MRSHAGFGTPDRDRTRVAVRWPVVGGQRHADLSDGREKSEFSTNPGALSLALLDLFDQRWLGLRPFVLVPTVEKEQTAQDCGKP
jgi:hypothetical protein